MEEEANNLPIGNVAATRVSSTNVSPLSSATPNRPGSQKPPPTPTNNPSGDSSSTSQSQSTGKTRSSSTTSVSSATPASSTIPIPISDKEADLKQQESILIDALDSKHNTCSPNAKLPPLRNPKSKLIMKNMQIKQKQQQLTDNGQNNTVGNAASDIGRLSSSARTSSAINPDSSSGSINAAAGQAVESAGEDGQEKSTGNGSGRIQRSSSSSVLEKRFETRIM